MATFMTRQPLRALTLGAVGVLALALFAACNGDGAGGPPADTTPGVTEPTPLADELQEAGEGPIFWRTRDQFESLQADEPYKVLFRVTGGYDEPTLTVLAECLSCEPSLEEMEFEALQAQPEGPEEPGSYYPFNLDLPEPGTWQLTVIAGDDQVSLPVSVAPASGSTRY